ncbi:redoxin domain-containing protein, partial [Rhizobium ruizarguesonis]
LATANFDGTVSFADLSGRPFVIWFFRGLHCPFCRRQLEQLAVVEPTLRAAGVETVAVINTPLERARLYFRHRPTPITLLCDPDCRICE